MPFTQAASPNTIVEHRREEFLISTDRARLDLGMIHGFLTNCYWARGVPREVVERSIEHALCFGIYDGSGAQVGFARVISDFATIAYVGDVFVLDTHRGRGLGKWLMECITRHQVGFAPVKSPERYMERHDPHVYETSAHEIRKTT
jgi:GNAT superfamily N-acetyltransferase